MNDPATWFVALLVGGAFRVMRSGDPAARLRTVVSAASRPHPPGGSLVLAVRALVRSARARAGRGAPPGRAVREVVEAWAAGLRAGRPADRALDEAITDVPACRDLLARTSASLVVGGDLGAALAQDAARLRDPTARRGLAAATACWTVAQHSGARLADALDRVAQTARADEVHVAHVRAQLSGPRATARLLAALPLLALVLASSLGIEAWQVLTGDPIGRAVLIGGLTLDVLGLVWTSRLARSAERSA